MTSLSNEVKDLFQPRSDLLDLRREAAKTLSPNEWTAYKKAIKEFDGERRYTQRQYELEYPNRVNEVRRRLINEA
mgnify:FL=1